VIKKIFEEYLVMADNWAICLLNYWTLGSSNNSVGCICML